MPYSLENVLKLQNRQRGAASEKDKISDSFFNQFYKEQGNGNEVWRIGEVRYQVILTEF